MKKLSLFVIAILLFVGCSKQFEEIDGDYPTPILPAQAYAYQIDDDVDVPLHIAGPLTSKIESITDDGATLGRVLFYDRSLSINNSTSCGSCHLQNKAFADGLAASRGFNSGLTSRNSPSVVNMIFEHRFFWDGRASSLEQQVLMPIQDHIEMGLDDTDYLLSKVRELPYYQELFINAFGSDQVTLDRISDAMAQFIHSMLSVDSKFDRGFDMDYSNFSTLEKEGADLFFDHSRTHCSQCHSPTFSGWSQFANIGLDMEYTDPGRGGVGEFEDESALEGVFKVPSLRNVELTAPYMHDGRFETLEEVVDHYNSGVEQHPNLDWRMTNQVNQTFLAENPNPSGEEFQEFLEPWRLELTEREKSALVAFLKTLTDRSFETDPRFSDPFN